jgi:predicted dehydrogenase
MSVQRAPLSVAVIGVGRMGSHHARTYAKLPQARLVAVVDSNVERAAVIADQYGCDSLPDVASLLRKHPGIDAVSVAVPTTAHAEVASGLLARGVGCLVEKPLAPTTQEAKALSDLAHAHGTTLQVGHTERFNPAVRAVAGMGISPRFMEVHRVSPMTFRSLDVGVVMDMMIHDLDIVLTLARSPLAQVVATGVAVLGSHEDVANARLVFESGCVANLTASRLALKTERKMRLFSEEAYVNLDYQKRSGLVIRKSLNAATLDEVRRKLAAGGDLTKLDYRSLVRIEELNMDVPAGHEDPLTAELSEFLDAVAQRRRPLVDGVAGYAAVDAADRVLRSLRDHRWEGLPARAVLDSAQ